MECRSLSPARRVLEVNMLGMDGFEILSTIRRDGLPVRVVMLTARSMKATSLSPKLTWLSPSMPWNENAAQSIDAKTADKRVTCLTVRGVKNESIARLRN